MWFGRFWPIVPVLAIAGSLAAKKRVPADGRHHAHARPLFVVLLIGTVVLVGALTSFRRWRSGPVVEHLHARCTESWRT